MSRKRQPAFFDRLPDRQSAIATLTHDYPAGHLIAWHFHDRDQLVYASRGVMTVRADDGTWVVPTHRAVWIPARTRHTITASGTVAMRTLYLQTGLVETLRPVCCVVNVSPLLRELILQACRTKSLKRSAPRQRHLIDVIVDQLEVIQMVPLQLPHVSDVRARRVVQMLEEDPSDARILAQLCKASGAGKRTVERIFQRELGISFGRWRQQLRLMQAVRLLAEGMKVTHAAMEAGYSSPSAFISTFKKALGTTPARYFGTPNEASTAPTSAPPRESRKRK
jgi:AraC-like DNA-binding protein/mannose-6-phosphate isomerase-like protein (cupin superfamily)